MLRWTVLGCLILGLAGCGFGKKDKPSAPKSGARGEQSSPIYPWKQPPDDLQPRPSPPAKSGKTDPF